MTKGVSMNSPTHNGQGTSLRISERAPNACTSCKRWKVKCDKKIPCSRCIKKGKASTCEREVVILRKKIQSFIESKILEDEIGALKQQLAERDAELEHLKQLLRRQRSPTSPAIGHVGRFEDVEQYEFEIQYVVRNLADTGSVSSQSLQSLQPIDRWDAKDENYQCHSTDWSTQKDQICKLMKTMSRAACFEITEFGLKYLNAFHGAVVPSIFLAELDCFWKDHNHIHIFEETYGDTSRSLAQQRLTWFSLLYSVLAGGFFVVPDEILEKCGLAPLSRIAYGRFCFTSALECLLRSDFLECSSLSKLQAFGAMNTCFHVFGKTRMFHSMLEVMIGAARKLGLDKLSSFKGNMTFSDYELGKRLWWNLVAVDAFEEYGRVSSIPLNSFTTELPGRYSTFDLPAYPFGLTESPVDFFGESTYQMVIIEETKIRKMDSKSKEGLLMMDRKLRDLLASFEVMLQKNDVFHKAGDAYWLHRLLLLNSIQDHITSVNKRIASFVSKNEWMASHREVCVKHSMDMLRLFLEYNLPESFYNFWLLSHNFVAASSFLVVDILINVGLQKKDERLSLVLKCISRLEKLRPPYNGASKGIRWINDLIGCIISLPTNSNKRVPLKKFTFPEIELHLETGNIPERLVHTTLEEVLQGSQSVEFSNLLADPTSLLSDFADLDCELRNEITSLLSNWEDAR